MKLHHVGVCSKNIEKSIKDIKKIHNIVEQTDIIFDPLQNAALCMITIEDGTKIELISGKVVENLIRKKIDYYHICYEVKNIEETANKMISNGAVQLSKIKPAILFNNKRVVFLKVSYGLIELVEK